MRRRTYLRLLGLPAGVGLLSGCSGRFGASENGTRTPLPDETVDFPSGPKEPPERPASLTEATAREYVREYERRYVYNELWTNEDSVVGVACEGERVEYVGVGYRVVVSCRGQSKTGGSDPNATVVYGDWFETTRTYLVDDDSLIRRRTDASTTR